MQFSKNFIWIVLIFIVALVAYTIGQQGQTVRKFSVNREGVTFEFDELKKVPQDELNQRQDELDRKLSEIQKDFRRTPQLPPHQRDRQQYNLNGTWQSNLGAFYNISQYGNAIAIQEVNPIYGVTAIGQGMLNQQVINLDYTTALYTQGKGILTVSDDGRQIEGRFTDLSTGLTITAVLYR